MSEVTLPEIIKWWNTGYSNSLADMHLWFERVVDTVVHGRRVVRGRVSSKVLYALGYPPGTVDNLPFDVLKAKMALLGFDVTRLDENGEYVP